MYPASLSRMVLVGAAGMKPHAAEIADIFLMTIEEGIALRFYDPAQVPDYDALFGQELTHEDRQTVAWDREMAALLTWKPYMHNPKMPHLMAQVKLPTLIVWGKQDAIVPVECGELYQQAIPGAALTVIDRCGHSPQLERPDAFLAAVLTLPDRGLMAPGDKETTMVDVYYFTEMPYAAFDETEAERYPSMRLTFPNSYFDADTAHGLFRDYFDQYQWAEEVGFDGLMINEHHNTPSCMDVAVNLSAAVLARVTKRAKNSAAGQHAADDRQPGAPR